MKEVVCFGQESNFDECDHFESSNCDSDDQAAGVVCFARESKASDDPSAKETPTTTEMPGTTESFTTSKRKSTEAASTFQIKLKSGHHEGI